MKIFRKRKNKGFTLVELIVVMAVMSILMIAVFSLFAPVQRIVASQQKATLDDTTVANIQTYIQKSLANSSMLTVKYIDPDETDETKVTHIKNMADYTLLDTSLSNPYTLQTTKVEIAGVETVVNIEELKCLRMRYVDSPYRGKGYILERLEVDQGTGQLTNIGAIGTYEFVADPVFNDAYYGRFLSENSTSAVCFDFELIESTNNYTVETAMSIYSDPTLSPDSLTRKPMKNSFPLLNMKENMTLVDFAPFYKLTIDTKPAYTEVQNPDIYLYYLVNIG